MEALFHFPGRRKAQFIPHHQVERCLRRLHDFMPAAFTAGRGNDPDAAALKDAPDFISLFSALQIHFRKAQHIHGSRNGAFFLHFLHHPQEGPGKAFLKGAFQSAAVHGIYRPGTAKLFRNALYIIANETGAAVALQKDPLCRPLTLNTRQAPKDFFFRAVYQRRWRRTGARDAAGRPAVFIIDIFHGIEITP